MTLPNFFIAGAPKAGTDELYYELDQHPEIYMSPLKEPCYFAEEIRVENFEREQRQHAEKAGDVRAYIDAGAREKRFSGIVTSAADYARLFERANGQKAIGEGSVCYLWSRTAAGRIAAEIPRARIIIVLMDPAERAFHQYLKSVSDGRAPHSFGEHIEAARSYGTHIGAYHPFLDFGNYGEQVKRYLDRFPAEQLFISLYEDTASDRQAWLRRVFSFLGVDAGFVPEAIEAPSKPRAPIPGGMSKVREVMPPAFRRLARKLVDRAVHLPTQRPEDRARLVEYYRDDVLRLQNLIRRDLSLWLR